MTVDRLLRTEAARDLIQLTRGIADDTLDVIIDEQEKNDSYPNGVFGTLVCAHSLFELQVGSDAAVLTFEAKPKDDGYVGNGAKTWITHGGIAYYYDLFARIGEGTKGVSCYLISGTRTIIRSAGPKRRRACMQSPRRWRTNYDDALVPSERRIGTEVQGLQNASHALDSGRSGLPQWPSASQ